VTAEPGGERALSTSSRYPVASDTRDTVEFRQNVIGIFAFHKSGFKPNARSYNVVMEDLCHFLKYGTVLHGEWFIDGQRVPLASSTHRQPLPPGLSERPAMAPVFPEITRMEARHDGCPNQFDYGTNYHQTAEWRSKTAAWALGHAKARCAEAEAAISEAQAALQAVPSAAKSAAAGVLARAQAMGRKVAAETEDIVQSDGLAGAWPVEPIARTQYPGHRRAVLRLTTSPNRNPSMTGAITRAHTKLIAYHGKAGYDSLGYVPKMAVCEAIASGALLNPGTRELVLYLAQHRPSPSVAKADKTGWEAVGSYVYAFYDTAKFTRFAVPDATSFKGCQQNHRFIGLCDDRRRAELDGPLRVAKGFCACDPCLRLETDDCLLPQLVGKAMRAKAPLAKARPCACRRC